MLNKLISSLLLITVLNIHAEEKVVFTKKTIELEIEQLKKQIEEEEKLWAEEKAREVLSETKRKERLKDLEAEKITLKSQITQSENEIQKGIQSLENLKNQKNAINQKFESLNQSVLSQVISFKEELVSTIPYQYEQRFGGLGLLEQDLRKKTISVEEGFSRLFASYQKELRLASDAEMYSGEVDLPSGDKMAVKYIRVGKQLLAYSSPTGTQVGILRKKDNKSWEWVREDALNLESRQAIRVAVGTAEGKEVPGYVELPFWINDFKDVEKDVVTESVQDTTKVEVK